MDFKEFTAGPDDNDRRLDRIARIFVPQLSLSEIYKYIRKGLIKVNSKKSKAENHVFEGDVISFASFIVSEKNTENEQVVDGCKTQAAQTAFPQIVFQNKNLLIINKPYDISVHGSDNSLDKQVVNYYKQNFNSESLSFNPGPLHRLDRKTSGLLCFSLSLDGARWFSKNIETHTIKKSYYAILQGKLPEKSIWKDLIKKSDDKTETGFHTVKIRGKSENGKSDENQLDEKEAVTIAKPVAYGKFKGKDVTFAKILIETGRTHQIRSQSALHGFPLMGDSAYGGMNISGQKTDGRDFYLQAFELCFPENPVELPPVIRISPDSDFISMLKSCEIDFSRL